MRRHFLMKRHIFVPHLGHLPFIIGWPFFVLVLVAPVISFLALHLNAVPD